MDVLVAICGPCFAFTFALYRIVLWWKVVYRLWSDAKFVQEKGLVQLMRPGKTYVLRMFLALSVPMGLLQLYWFRSIVERVVTSVSGAS